jgi:hypothetical protein
MRRTIALFACIAPCWISTPLQSAEVFSAWNLAYDTKAHTAERTERDAGTIVTTPILSGLHHRYARI